MAVDSICVGEDDHIEAQKSDDGEGDVRALESTACSMEPIGEGGEQDVEEDIGGTPEWPATGSENEEEHNLLAKHEEMEEEDSRGRLEVEKELGSHAIEEMELQDSQEQVDCRDEEADGEDADDEEADGEEGVEEEELEDEGMWEEGEEEQGEEEGDFEVGADGLGDEEDEGMWEEGEEEEEDQWEEEIEEEEEVWETEMPAQKAPSKLAASQQAELAQHGSDSRWATQQKSGSEAPRQWGNRRNNGAKTEENVLAAQSQSVPPKAVPGNKAKEQLHAPKQSSLVGRNRGESGSTENVNYGDLQKENRQLRLELGQAMFKVQQLGKLREQAAESQRKEMMARQKEARAVKELELAKEYVGKRDSFARSEKAELMHKVRQLEDTLAAINGREDGLKTELAEATMYRSEAAQLVDDAQKDIDKWKHEAIEHAKNVKRLEQRLQQLEEKRQQDKTRLRELSNVLREQQHAHRQDDQNTDNITSYEVKVPAQAPGKRAGSKPPEKKAGKKGNDSTDGKVMFEDPIKPIINKDFLLADDNNTTNRFGFAGVQSALGTIWSQTLKPLVLSDGSSAISAGGCSGAPGRGKGKKAAKNGSKTGAVSKDSDLVNGLADDDGRRQNLILLTLVVFIACLAVYKSYFNVGEDVRS